MKARWPTSVAAAVLTVSAAGAGHAAPALRCRHPLTMVSAVALPPAVARPLSSWMALHGEPWSKGDAVSPGELIAGFEWAANSGADWIVAYRVGGIACCSTRFALMVPRGAAYAQVIPPSGGTDWFGQPTCAGIDPALDAYGNRR